MEGKFYQQKAKEFREVGKVLRLIGNPIRLAIIDLLRKHDRLTVNDICRFLGLRQAVASTYLKRMRGVGIVGCERKGRWAFYFIKDKRVLDIIDCLVHCSRR